MTAIVHGVEQDRQSGHSRRRDAQVAQVDTAPADRSALLLRGLLREVSFPYCILHGWEQPPNAATTDVDIALGSADLGKLEEQLVGGAAGSILQLMEYERFCYYFVLAPDGAGPMRMCKLDAGVDLRLDGRVFLRSEDLLRGRRLVDGIWVASPHVEFVYLLIKKIHKGVLPPHQRARLHALDEALGADAVAAAGKFLGRWGPRVAGWIAAGDWPALEANLPVLRRVLRRQALVRDPLSGIRYWIPDLRRRWRRWRHPTGLCVALLGPDGAGKSTLANGLPAALDGAFRRSVVFHLRPRLRAAKTEPPPVTDPHGHPPRSWWLSILKLGYYVLAYAAGYALAVRPRLARSGLVLFDRYYDDLVVDPRRFRYGGPAALVHRARRLVPTPDLYLILDVAEDRLLARKQEVPRKELRRQRDEYRRLALGYGRRAVLLDGSRPPAEVIGKAAEAVAGVLHQRYLTRRRLWFAEARPDDLRWLSGVLSPPSWRGAADGAGAPQRAAGPPRAGCEFGWLRLSDGRGYLFPRVPGPAAAAAVELYNAQNPKARLAKRALAAGMRFGLGSCLLPGVALPLDADPGMDDAGGLLGYLREALGHPDLYAAVSLGTPGPFRKPVLQVFSSRGETLGFAKVGSDARTNALVQHEAEILALLGSRALRSFRVPRVLHLGRWNGRVVCVQSPPHGRAAVMPEARSPQLLHLLDELATVSLQCMPLAQSDAWLALRQQVEQVSDRYAREVLSRGVRLVEEWSGAMAHPFHFSHGDFAPWNIKLSADGPFVFDWEYAMPLGIPAQDLLHYRFQTLRLLRGCEPHELYAALLDDAVARANVSAHLARLNAGRVPYALVLASYRLQWMAREAAATSCAAALRPEMQAFASFLHTIE